MRTRRCQCYGFWFPLWLMIIAWQDASRMIQRYQITPTLIIAEGLWDALCGAGPC